MKRTITVFALLSLAACKGDGDSDKSKEATSSAKTTETTVAKPEAKPAKAGPLALEKLGLTIDAPAGAEVSDMAGSLMVQAPGLVLSVELANDFSPSDLKAQVEEAKDMYSGTILTQEEVEGGWHMTFNNKGGMGTNYWSKSYLTIDGKAYTCGTTSPKENLRDAALAACKTLKKK